MLLVCAVAGLVLGWLAEVLTTRLPRWTGHIPPSHERAPLGLPAILRWPGRQPGEDRSGLAAELSSAAFLAGLWAICGPSWEFWVLGASYFYLLLVALIDLKYRLVLNVMVYPALVVAVIAHLLAADQSMAHVLVGGGMAFSIFFLTAWLRPGQLGFGDVKLAALIGVGVGFPVILWALLAGTGAAGAVAIWLLRRGASAGTRIPYAPFLCLGALAALLVTLLPLQG